MNFKLSQENCGLVLTLRTDATYAIQTRLHISNTEFEDGPYPLASAKSIGLSFDVYSIKRNVFFFSREDFLGGELDWNARFLLGEPEIDVKDGSYFRVAGRKLGIVRDVLFDAGLELSPKCFCCGGRYQVSIFRHLEDVLPPGTGDIVIGGSCEDALPADAFYRLVDSFPTTSELELYARKRITSIVSEYLGCKRDYADDLEQLQMRHTQRLAVAEDGKIRGPSALHLGKRDSFLQALAEMKRVMILGDAVPERDWQLRVAEVLLLLFPQYIALYPETIIKGVPVHRGSFKRPDFLAIDASGNVDVIEIKKAFSQDELLRSVYRGNYIPAKELAGGIMQVETYLSCMSNWGLKGAKELREKLEGKSPESLPEELKLTFAHSRGLLVIGAGDFGDVVAEDFNVIRKQYGRIMDIITYSDLISRLERIVGQLQGLNSLVLNKEAVRS